MTYVKVSHVLGVHSSNVCKFKPHNGYCDVHLAMALDAISSPCGGSTAQAVLATTKQVGVVTRPLPRDGDMAEDHGAPYAGQLSRAWARVRRKTEFLSGYRGNLCVEELR